MFAFLCVLLLFFFVIVCMCLSDCVSGCVYFVACVFSNMAVCVFVLAFVCCGRAYVCVCIVVCMGVCVCLL